MSCKEQTELEELMEMKWAVRRLLVCLLNTTSLDDVAKAVEYSANLELFEHVFDPRDPEDQMKESFAQVLSNRLLD